MHFFLFIFFFTNSVSLFAFQKPSVEECLETEKQLSHLSQKPRCEEMQWSFCESQDVEKHESLLKMLSSCPASFISKSRQREIKILNRINKKQKSK